MTGFSHLGNSRAFDFKTGPALHLNSVSERRHVMDQDHAKDWRELCKAAANELDPKKLMALIGEITRALDERDERRKIASENERMTSRVFPVRTVA
jgi:hypothetical protein